MKLQINVPVSGLDLASLLEGEQGLFLPKTGVKTTSRLRSLVIRSYLGRCQLVRRFRNKRQLSRPSRGSSRKSATPLSWPNFVAASEKPAKSRARKLWP